MKKIYLSAGHSSKIGRNVDGKTIDNGASGNGFVEGVVAEELRSLIVKELTKKHIHVITDGNNTVLSQTIQEFKKTADKNSILVDIHLNASSNPKATGTETLVPNNPSILERQIAQDLSKVVSETLGIQVRGVKGVKTEAESARGSLGFMRLIGENVLMEICFISNPSDMAKYTSNKQKLAENIADVLIKYASVGESEEVKDKFYTVVKGDTLSKIAAANRTTITKLKKDNGLKSDLIQIGQKLKL